MFDEDKVLQTRIFFKIRNKNKKLSITCSHIWHFVISILIKYTVSESLEKIQQFRHEWSSKMYENPKKTQ